MRLNIDKLMIGFVMILAVCLYAPTLLEDYKANSTTNEKVTEVLAEAPAPAMTTESMVLAAVTTQERIGEAVQAAKVTESIGNDMTKAVTTDVAHTEVSDKYECDKYDRRNIGCRQKHASDDGRSTDESGIFGVHRTCKVITS